MGKYPTPPGDSLEPLVRAFKHERRERRENARPGGTNIAELVKKVREALVNINATVIAATNAYLSSAVLNVTGVIASGGVTAGGRVVSTSPIRSPGSRSYVVATGYAGAWIETDGTIGIAPSSRRFKTDIEEWLPDISKLLHLRAVLFRYDTAVFPWADPEAPKQLGFIAEELEALGFSEFLFYDSDGLVEGINYDRLTIALLVLAQWQEARLLDVETRLSAAGL